MKTHTYHPSMACVTAACSCMQTSHRRESSLARSLARSATKQAASKQAQQQQRPVRSSRRRRRRLSSSVVFFFLFFLREGTKTKRVWSDQEDEKVGKVGRQKETAKRDERRKGVEVGQVGRRKEVGRFSIMVFGLFRTHHHPRVGFVLFGVRGGGWGPPSPLLDPYSTPPTPQSLRKNLQHFSLYIQRYLHSYTSKIFLSVFLPPPVFGGCLKKWNTPSRRCSIF